MQIQYFDTITIPIPKEKIYARLGFAKGKTYVTAEQKQLIETYIDEATTLIELKGAGIRLPIEGIDAGKITLIQNLILDSRSLSEMLANCEEVLFMGATAGAKIMEEIQKDSITDELTKAVILDAAASEIVDSALGWIMTNFGYDLRRENKTLTSRRFSAGYGDLTLENQKIIYDVLDLKKFGVSLTDSYMLVPEKSVTAIAGIKAPVE